MKLLFSADLHAPADEGPYRRLALFARERGCGLVAIAGDLLDLFAKGSQGTQTHSAAGWLKALATKVPHLAVCSGNHDPDSPEGARWLARAAAEVPAGNLLVDGNHAVLRPGRDDEDGLLVSCCPYWNIQERGVTHHRWLRDQAEKIWIEGRRLADGHRRLPWVVLHHEPPANTRLRAGALPPGFDPGAFACAEWSRAYRPDYVLCGHLHESPFVAGGAWADRAPGSPTWAFNPGRDREGSRLVEIDLAARVARWLTWDGEEADALDLQPGSERTPKP